MAIALEIKPRRTIEFAVVTFYQFIILSMYFDHHIRWDALLCPSMKSSHALAALLLGMNNNAAAMIEGQQLHHQQQEQIKNPRSGIGQFFLELFACTRFYNRSMSYLCAIIQVWIHNLDNIVVTILKL